MRLMEILLILAFACAAVFSFEARSADAGKGETRPQTNCSEAALQFGVMIQDLIRGDDLAGLMRLVPGELYVGPRQAYAKGKTFDELFSESWMQEVLEDKPCHKVGWRGYSIGPGSIWYDKAEGEGFQVITINGAIEETPPYTPSSANWEHGSRTLGPQCFSQIWLSGDNYEDYDRYVSLASGEDWSWATPGEYFGKEFPFPEPPAAFERGNLTRSFSACSFETLSLGDETPLYQSVGSEFTEVCRKVENRGGDCGGGAFYEKLAPLQRAHCQSLAPNIEATCVSAFILRLSQKDCGICRIGSMGPSTTYAAYGLFEYAEGDKYIVPLVNFRNRNTAINFAKTQ